MPTSITQYGNSLVTEYEAHGFRCTIRLSNGDTISEIAPTVSEAYIAALRREEQYLGRSPNTTYNFIENVMIQPAYYQNSTITYPTMHNANPWSGMTYTWDSALLWSSPPVKKKDLSPYQKWEEDNGLVPKEKSKFKKNKKVESDLPW